MGNVLKMDKQQQISSLHQLGYSERAINRMTGIHRTTIRRWISNEKKEIPLASDEVTQIHHSTSENPPDEASSSSRSLAEPFRETILAKWHQGFTAQRIYQDLVEIHGNSIGYQSIKRFIQKLKDDKPKYYSRLVHAAGEEAQVDFGVGSPVLIDGKYRKTWLFKMTLSFSGHSYEELVFSQDVETFIRCHERAFRFFGGVPVSVKLDNLKAGVLTASLYDPDLNPVYLAFANHWGFAANPCAPYRPEHKGKVERDVGYTKDNALKGLKFDSLEAGNAHLRNWNFTWAQKRVHGGHKKVVIDLFLQFEQPLLKPLKEIDFSWFKIGERKVDVHGHIEVESNLYSVPFPRIGHTVKVQYNSQFIKVFDQKMNLLCVHRPLPGKGKRCTKNEHVPSWNWSREQHELYLADRAAVVGVNCEELTLKVLVDTIDPMSIRRARGIVYLDKKYSASVLELACGFVLQSGDFRVKRVKAKCEELIQKQSTVPVALTQVNEIIRDLNEYAKVV